MAEIQQMLETIKGMTMVQVNDLVKAIEDEFGVSAASGGGMMMMAGPAAAAEEAEEQTEFDVVLTAIGDKKINVIKAVRGATSLGLKEAKEVVESVPSTIKEAISKEEAEELAKTFKEAGATVEIK